MSESNLHMQFFDEENVPIPIPPADQSWKLMEQALNKAMPVNSPSGGNASPFAGSIGDKLLTIVKYAVVTVLSAGAIYYGIHRMTHSEKAALLDKHHSTMTGRSDSLSYQAGATPGATVAEAENNGLSTSGNVPSSVTGQGSSSRGAVNNGATTSGKTSSSGNGQGTASGGVVNNRVSASSNAQSSVTGQGAVSGGIMNNGVATSGKTPSGVNGQGTVSGGAVNNGLSTFVKNSSSVKGQGATIGSASANRATVTGPPMTLPVGHTTKRKAEKKNATVEKSAIGPEKAREGNLSNSGKENLSTTNNPTSTKENEPTSNNPSLATPDLASGNTIPNKKLILKNNSFTGRKSQSPIAQQSVNTTVVDHPGMVAPSDISSPGTMGTGQPGYPAIIQCQSLRPSGSIHATLEPLKVSAETMQLMANYRMPKSKIHMPGNWEAMAQWSVAMPINSNAGFYNGPAGNSQLYRLIIPGIRAQRTWKNAAISLDLNVMATQTYDHQPYMWLPWAGSTGGTTSLTLLQTFGYKAGLAYHHRLVGQFFGSAGIQGYIGHTGSIQRVSYIRDSLGVHSNTTININKDSLWNSIGKFQGNITAEVYYDLKRWQIGARTAIPVIHSAKDSAGINIKPTVQLEILLRWKIWKNK